MKTDVIVAVVGSLNVDRTFRVPRIPAPGETLTAREAFSCFGGKGANQAVAACRAGGQVRMIGCVGSDDDGAAYRRHLESEGIDTNGVRVVPGASTGCAFITVDDHGENAIVVHPGANHSLRPGMIGGEMFEGVDVVLMQLECPLDTVVYAAAVARAAGAEVVLNPSPWDDALRDGGMTVDVCIVNETEARALVGREMGEFRDDPGRILKTADCRVLVVTRGGRPAMVVSGCDDLFEVRPPQVEPVDTVGAGDTFAGAFVVARGGGAGLREAVEFANAAAALSTLEPGAQEAIPDRARTEAFLARRRC
jgi:ribokinase